MATSSVTIPSTRRDGSGHVTVSSHALAFATGRRGPGRLRGIFDIYAHSSEDQSSALLRRGSVVRVHLGVPLLPRKLAESDRPCKRRAIAPVRRCRRVQLLHGAPTSWVRTLTP